MGCVSYLLSGCYAQQTKCYFSFLYRNGHVLCKRLICYILRFLEIDCHSAVWQMTLVWLMVTTKQFTSRRHVFTAYLTSVSQDSLAQTVYMVESYPA